jgi:sigma-E factor negative regulatory protein RseB
MRSRSALLFLVLCTGTGSAAAGEGTDEWLLRVSDAARLSNYQGVVVYRDDDKLETLRITHRQKDGREQERITSLSGEPRDVFREEDRVTSILPKGPAQQHAQDTGGSPKSLFPMMSRETLARAAAHYEFRELGQARVAGRQCRGVALVPRDEYRYGYQVCADSETAVPLKVSLLDHKGKVLEQMMFTEIQYPENIPDQMFALPADVRGAVPTRPDVQVVSQDLTLENWALNRLPPGFRVAQREIRPMENGEGELEHVLLSDGLSAVSVFRVHARSPGPAGERKLFSGFSRMGAMHAYGRIVGRFHVTVVGEVPKATVRMIGDGMDPEPDASDVPTVAAPVATEASAPGD